MRNHLVNWQPNLITASTTSVYIYTKCIINRYCPSSSSHNNMKLLT